MLDDVPESLTEACVVAPGRTAITAPATATLANGRGHGGGVQPPPALLALGHGPRELPRARLTGGGAGAAAVGVVAWLAVTVFPTIHVNQFATAG